MVKVMYNVYKEVIWAFFGISLWTLSWKLDRIKLWCEKCQLHFYSVSYFNSVVDGVIPGVPYKCMRE